MTFVSTPFKSPSNAVRNHKELCGVGRSGETREGLLGSLGPEVTFTSALCLPGVGLVFAYVCSSSSSSLCSLKYKSG